MLLLLGNIYFLSKIMISGKKEQNKG